LGVPHTVIFVLNHRNCRTRINESLAQEAQTKADYDKTIRETEAAYTKILESSQTLLHVLRRETAAQKKISAQNKKETDKLSKLLLNVQNIMTFFLVSLFAIK